MNPKSRTKKKRLLKVYIIEALMLLVLCIALGVTISSNRNNKVISSSETTAEKTSSEGADEINARDGVLQVNSVNVNVPNNADYNITYGWSSSDTDYPTKPLIATATYRDKNETILYEFSLYKDSFFNNSEIPKGKTVNNWYDDWETVKEEKCTQKSYQAKDIKGFLITSVNDSSPLFHTNNFSTTSSFYFVVKAGKGIEQYIFEGTCHEEAAVKDFNKMMEKSLNSIRIGENL